MVDLSVAAYRPHIPGTSPLLGVLEYGAHRISTQIEDRKLDVFAVVMVERGRGRLSTASSGGHVVVAPAVFWLWPGMAHSYGPDDGTDWDEQWALFEGRIANDVLASALIEPRQPLLPLHDLGEMQRLFALLRVEMGDDTHLARASAGARIHRIALTAAHQSLIERRERTEHPIAPAIEALRERAFDTVDLTRFAEEFGMSPATLRRKFIAATGAPPKAFQLRLRLDRAKEMLAITDAGIEAIAHQTGFEDAFYFSRIFAQREGMSPSSFRNANRRA
jgi:AraC-like DNA-binding protein